MTDTEVVPLPVATSAVPMEIPAAEKRRRWFELGLVLLIAFAAFILQAIYLLVNGPEGVPHLSSTARFAYGITQEAGSLLLLGYVLSRRGLRIADLGLRWSVRDAGVGLLLAVLSYVAIDRGIGSSMSSILCSTGPLSTCHRPANFLAIPRPWQFRFRF